MIDARLGSLRQTPAARAAQAQAKPTEPEAPPTDPQDTVTVGTYNVRNLFDKANQNPNINTVAKTPTAIKAAFGNIAEADADIVALQEVENLKILTQTLKKSGLNKVYPHVVLVEGNDQRGIDVALISKHPIKRVVSYKDREFPTSEGKTTQFCRDLLRVDLDVKGHPFTVYTTHLKSQMGGDPATVKRLAEASEMRKILEEDMTPFPSRQFVVTGDFNDKASSETLKTVMGDDLVNSLAGQHAVTYPAKKVQFDYVLYPQHMQDQFVSSEVRPNVDGSDHSMVVTTFRLAR